MLVAGDTTAVNVLMRSACAELHRPCETHESKRSRDNNDHKESYVTSFEIQECSCWLEVGVLT